MSVKYAQVSLTGGAAWKSQSISGDKVSVDIVSTVGDDYVEVSFNGSDVADVLGPIDSRPMSAVYEDISSYRIYLKCASNAVVKVNYWEAL